MWPVMRRAGRQRHHRIPPCKARHINTGSTDTGQCPTHTDLERACPDGPTALRSEREGVTADGDLAGVIGKAAALADSTAETKGGAGKASLDLVAFRAGREGSLVKAADRSTVGNVTVSIAAG